MTPDFYALKLTPGEFDALVRLIGHHTTGGGFERVYNAMVQDRPWEANEAGNKGPLPSCEAGTELYSGRPMVSTAEYRR